MKELRLTAEQEVEAERIETAIAGKIRQESRSLARMLASKKTSELFGQTEFDLRDGCLRMGQTILQQALDERKKKTTRDRA